MSKKKKNPIWLFLLIGLIVIAIAVVIVFVIIKPFQKEKKIEISDKAFASSKISDKAFASSINRINKITDNDIKKMFQTQENYQLPEGDIFGNDPSMRWSGIIEPRYKDDTANVKSKLGPQPDTASVVDTEAKKLACDSFKQNPKEAKKLVRIFVTEINKVGGKIPDTFVDYLVNEMKTMCNNQVMKLCKQNIKNIVLYIVFCEKVANALLNDEKLAKIMKKSELYNFIILFSFDTFRSKNGLSDDDLKKIGIAADKEYSEVTAEDIEKFMNKIQNNKTIPEC